MTARSSPWPARSTVIDANHGERVDEVLVDVGLLFTPDAAAPGEQITLRAYVANLSNRPLLLGIMLSISCGPHSKEALPFALALAAGQTYEARVPFAAPSLPLGGKLSVMMTAAAAASSDTASATVTIAPGSTAAFDATALSTLGVDIGRAFTDPDKKHLGTRDNEDGDTC